MGLVGASIAVGDCCGQRDTALSYFALSIVVSAFSIITIGLYGAFLVNPAVIVAFSWAFITLIVRVIAIFMARRALISLRFVAYASPYSSDVPQSNPFVNPPPPAAYSQTDVPPKYKAEQQGEHQYDSRVQSHYQESPQQGQQQQQQPPPPPPPRPEEYHQGEGRYYHQEGQQQ